MFPDLLRDITCLINLCLALRLIRIKGKGEYVQYTLWGKAIILTLLWSSVPHSKFSQKRRITENKNLIATHKRNILKLQYNGIDWDLNEKLYKGKLNEWETCDTFYTIQWIYNTNLLKKISEIIVRWKYQLLLWGFL